MTVERFIKERPYLVWHTRNFKGLSEEAVVESVLNFGDFDDVKKLISILGIRKAARIFRRQTDPRRRRVNYRPAIKNYFRLYFGRYA